MAQVTEQQRAEVAYLIRRGVSQRKAAMVAQVSRSTANRIAAQMPFIGGPQPAPRVPPVQWDNDQTPPPPSTLTFDARYHGHTFKSYAQPVAFDGWTIERIRSACSLHRMGYFLESSLLSVALLGFPPVFAALHQRMAPILALSRHVRAGTRGLSRILGEEIERQLAPSAGLAPSPHFPSTLWGSMIFDRAFAGFSVLQHAYGEPDPALGVRPIYTRRWPTWATQRVPGRTTFQAITSEGPVDIISGDGKFTLIADTEDPHHAGAVLALGEEAFDGKSTQRSRAAWIDKYGDPKLWAEMPPNIAVRSPEGIAFFEALASLRDPGGIGVIPSGGKLDWASLTASSSTAIVDALRSNVEFVALVLLGTSGTVSPGNTGGVYTSPTFATVARTVVDRDLKAIVRGINTGHVGPQLQFNYATSIATSKGWSCPALDIPLPDPEADTRIKSLSDRMAALIAQVEAERAAGFDVTQDRVNQIARTLMVDAPLLQTLVTPVATVATETKPTKASLMPKPAMPRLPRMVAYASGVNIRMGSGDNFDEADHPRDDSGKFGSGGGGDDDSEDDDSEDSDADDDDDKEDDPEEDPEEESSNSAWREKNSARIAKETERAEKTAGRKTKTADNKQVTAEKKRATADKAEKAFADEEAAEKRVVEAEHEAKKDPTPEKQKAAKDARKEHAAAAKKAERVPEPSDSKGYAEEAEEEAASAAHEARAAKDAVRYTREHAAMAQKPDGEYVAALEERSDHASDERDAARQRRMDADDKESAAKGTDSEHEAKMNAERARGDEERADLEVDYWDDAHSRAQDAIGEEASEDASRSDDEKRRKKE